MGNNALLMFDLKLFEGGFMKKLLAAAVVGLLSMFSFSALAGDFSDYLVKVGEARSTAIAMLMHKDQRGAAEQKHAKETGDAARALFAKLKAPAGKEAQFSEFKEVASAFMDTRENEVIPLILQGKDEDAKKILTGVQKERFSKMSALVDVLGK